MTMTDDDDDDDDDDDEESPRGPPVATSPAEGTSCDQAGAKI